MVIIHYPPPQVQTLIHPLIQPKRRIPSPLPPPLRPPHVTFVVDLALRDFVTWYFVDNNVTYPVASEETTSDPMPTTDTLIVVPSDEHCWVRTRAALASLGLQAEFHDEVIVPLRARLDDLIRTTYEDYYVCVEIQRLTKVKMSCYYEVDRDEICAVCLEPLQVFDLNDEINQDGDDPAIQRLPCKHFFHESCIFKWFKISQICPLCRHPCPYLGFSLEDIAE